MRSVWTRRHWSSSLEATLRACSKSKLLAGTYDRWKTYALEASSDFSVVHCRMRRLSAPPLCSQPRHRTGRSKAQPNLTLVAAQAYYGRPLALQRAALIRPPSRRLFWPGSVLPLSYGNRGLDVILRSTRFPQDPSSPELRYQDDRPVVCSSARLPPLRPRYDDHHVQQWK